MDCGQPMLISADTCFFLFFLFYLQTKRVKNILVFFIEELNIWLYLGILVSSKNVLFSVFLDYFKLF